MLSALIINFFKAIFGSFFKEEKIVSNLSERENEIFSKDLDNRVKEDWLQRIDFWIEEKNFKEAAKLCNYYTQNYFDFDDDIDLRINIVNEYYKNKAS